MQTVTRHKLGNLEVLGVAARENTANKQVVILLHGYGTSAHNLLPLHEYIKTPFPRETSWYFPNAPLKVPLGPLPNMYGRAWFPIDIEQLVSAQTSAKNTDDREKFLQNIPNGLESASQEIQLMLEAIMEEEKISEEQIIIGGFSQGAMMSTDISLRNNYNFAKLIILSGVLLAQDEWGELAKKHNSIPCFQSHGYQDPTLPFVFAEKLHTLLIEAQWPAVFCPFEGGHEIPPEIIQNLNDFMLRK